MTRGAGHRGRTVLKGYQEILGTVERAAQVVRRQVSLSLVNVQTSRFWDILNIYSISDSCN